MHPLGLICSILVKRVAFASKRVMQPALVHRPVAGHLALAGIAERVSSPTKEAVTASRQEKSGPLFTPCQGRTTNSVARQSSAGASSAKFDTRSAPAFRCPASRG